MPGARKMMRRKGGIVVYDTFNPADKWSQIALSNGDLDAKSVSNGPNGFVRSITSKNSGKPYNEFEIFDGVQGYHGYATSGVDNTLFAGLFAEGFAHWNAPGGSNNVWNNSSSTNTGGDSAVTDVLMSAIDFAAEKMWFGRNDVWFFSGNPATGANPTFSGFGALTLFVCAGGQNTGSMRTRWRSDPVNHTLSPPSGFTAGWPQ